MNTMTGSYIEKIKYLYQNRESRARELQKTGRKIFGYICLYPPVELITAFGYIPYRLLGDMKEPISKADAYLPTVVCPFLRSILDLGLNEKYSFLDGIITSHICDVGSSIASIWNYAVKTSYSYHLDTPHTTHSSALEQTTRQMRAFKQSLEKYAGKQLNIDELKKAIDLHNEQRALVRDLYALKKQNPPPVTGVETLMIVKVLQSIPVEEGNELLRGVLAEIKDRKVLPNNNLIRLMIWGSIIDDTQFYQLIEELGANVVVDDTCVGTRAFFQDLPLREDPIDGVAEHYLMNIKCPRTFRSHDLRKIKYDWNEDLQNRFDYLLQYAQEWKVDGVILESVRYCDTHGYEIPGITDYLSKNAIPSIYLEHDYTEGSLAQMRTRVQGLLEIIG